MSRIGQTVVSLAVLSGLAFAFFSGTPMNQEEDVIVGSRVATLYAHDPLMAVMDFVEGRPGRVFQNFEVRNRESHIDFAGYHVESFTVGIQGGEKGVIVDLGPPKVLAAKYGYSETVSFGQGYASIRRQGKKIVILQDQQQGSVQELEEGADLFKEPTQERSHAPVRLGHIYLARITGRSRDGGLMVKFMVIAHELEQSVTIRWDVL